MVETAASMIDSLASAGEIPAAAPQPTTPTIEGNSNGNQETSPQKGQEAPEEGLQVVKEPAGETTVTPPATFKAMLGELEQELAEDLTFNIKVDKQEQKIALKDLIRQFQGKIPIEKHMGQLKQDRVKFDGEKKAFDDERALVENHMKEIVDLLKTNPQKALEKIVLASGGNPGDYEALYAAETQDMDDRERKLFLKEKSLEHKEEVIRRQEEVKTKQITEDNNAKIISETLVAGAQKYGISQAEIDAAWKFTLSQAAAGKFEFSDMSPDQIGNMVVKHVMEEVRPGVVFEKAAKEAGFKGEVSPADSKFLKTLLQPGMEWNDVADIVKAYYNLNNSSQSEEILTETSESSTGGATKPAPRKITQKAKVEEADEDDDDNPVNFDALLRSAQRNKGRR